MRTIILLVLTLAQAVSIMSGMMMVQGMRQELAMAEARLGADVLVYPTAAVSKIAKDKMLMQGTPVEVYRDRSMLSRMDSCEDIAAVTHQIYISDTLEDGSDIWIIGYEPETDFVISPWLSDRKDMNVPAGSVIVGSRVQMEADGTVTLYGKAWTVAGRLMDTGSVMDSSVFASMTTLGGLLSAASEAGVDKYASVSSKSSYSAALVRVTDKSKVQSVTDWINIYVRKVTAVRSEATLTDAASGIQGTMGMMAVIAALVWLVLLFALGIIQSMLMKERMRELYVWHSIGATRGIINRVMLTEALLIYLAGSLAGAALSSLFFGLFGSFLTKGVSYTAGSIIAAVFVSVVVTVAAGLAYAYFSVRRAMRKLDAQMLLTV